MPRNHVWHPLVHTRTLYLLVSFFSILFLLGLVALALFMAWAWAAVMALAHGCHALYMGSHEGFWRMADMDSESV